MKYLIFVLLLFVLKADCQPNLLWEVRINTNSFLCYGQLNAVPKMKFDLEGNIILCSKRQNEPIDSDIVILKMSTEGEVLWEYTFDGENHLKDRIHELEIDNANNIVVVGESMAQSASDYLDTEKELLIFKLSSEGEMLWCEKELVLSYTRNRGNSLEINDDNEIYFTGKLAKENYYETFYTTKFSSEGEKIWESFYDADSGIQMKLFDEYLLVLGYSNDFKLMILRYDLEGNLISSNDIFDSDYFSKRPVVDEWGNIYLIKFVGAYGVTKYNMDGDEIWDFVEPTNLPDNVDADKVECIAIDEWQNVYLTGRHYGENYGDSLNYSNADILTMKLTPDGVEVWRNKYNDEGNNAGESGEFIQTISGGVSMMTGYQSNGVLGGETDELVFLYDELGEVQWDIIVDGGIQTDDIGLHLLIGEDVFYTSGWTTDTLNKGSHSIKKYSYDFMINTEDLNKDYEIKTYPNPVNDYVQIDFPFIITAPNVINIYSIDGVLIKSIENEEGDKVRIPLKLPNGAYIIDVFYQENRYLSKVVIQN